MVMRHKTFDRLAISNYIKKHPEKTDLEVAGVFGCSVWVIKNTRLNSGIFRGKRYAPRE
jgi:hypothetical protein